MRTLKLAVFAAVLATSLTPAIACEYMKRNDATAVAPATPAEPQMAAQPSAPAETRTVAADPAPTEAAATLTAQTTAPAEQSRTN